MIQRVALRTAMTRTQRLVALMVGVGCNYTEIAEALSISVFTAKRHAEDAAAKVPGNLPTQMKLIMWVRGVSLDALDGSSLQTMLDMGQDPLIDHTDNARVFPVIREKSAQQQALA